MSESRTVDYAFNAAELTELHEQVGIEHVQKALGYLSTWNFTFPKVRIWIDVKQCEIIATYFREDGATVGYCIGAVWHGDHFGFHS